MEIQIEQKEKAKGIPNKILQIASISFLHEMELSITSMN